jgi:hypothetical protein
MAEKLVIALGGFHNGWTGNLDEAKNYLRFEPVLTKTPQHYRRTSDTQSTPQGEATVFTFIGAMPDDWIDEN